MVDANELVKKFQDFLEDYYLQQLLEKERRKVNHLVIDFKKLDPELASLVLDDPEETLAAFNLAAVKHPIIISGLPQDFKIRIKNVSKEAKIKINEIRPSKHFGKMLIVEGMVKQKSDVQGQVSTAKFECKSCGSMLSIIQLDDRKFTEPSRCGCGYKGKFRIISKDLIDAYSILVEEPTEYISGGTKLSKMKVLCTTDLSNPEVERALFQGCRVQISGILKEIQILQNGKKTAMVDKYLDANYIKVFEESFMNVKWNKSEVEEFKKFAQRKDWLQVLRRSIFYDIFSYEEECEGIILQMFGGVGLERDGANVKGTINILLVGGPGTSKSEILQITDKFHPKSMYMAGKGVSGVGIIGAVVKDELLGGWCYEAGALVLCNNGEILLDEMDKISDDDKDALHQPMANERVSINKGNIQQTMVARTSILAAANPKFGGYSPYASIYSQIDLSTTLINRFDLIYPFMASKLTNKDNYEIGLKILGRGNESENEEVYAPELSKDFITKYIAYSKTINPTMSKEVQDFLAKKYEDLTIKKNASEEESVPISGRNVAGFRRMSEAVARSRLHEEVIMEDAEIGYHKIIYSLKQMGVDPESGDVKVEQFDIDNKSPSTITQKDLLASVRNFIYKQTPKNTTIDGTDIIKYFVDKGFDEMAISDCIEKLSRIGDILQRRRDQWQIVR